MAMILGHDYVTIISWDCPYCHSHHLVSTKIGRYPFARTLMCQTCTLEWMPGEAGTNVVYGSD